MVDPQQLVAGLTLLRDEAIQLKARLEQDTSLSEQELRKALLLTHQEMAAVANALIQLLTPGAVGPPPIPPAQLFEIQRRDAINQIWTESHLRGADDRSKHVIELGIVAVKSVFLVNGAAIVALLTFLGTGRGPSNSTMLQVAFGDFSLGLILALLSMGVAYVGQQLFSNAEYDKAGAVYEAVINNRPERPKAGQSPIGTVLQIVAACLSAGSLLFFCLGAFAALSGLFPSP